MYWRFLDIFVYFWYVAFQCKCNNPEEKQKIFLLKLFKTFYEFIGEGRKPIFDREELKEVAINEEQRLVVAISKEQLGMHYTNNF